MSIIKFEKVRYSYPGDELPSLCGIDLSIEKGQFVAILGHNGSGKSTLAKHMNAILVPDEGRVLINGKVAKKKSALNPADKIEVVVHRQSILHSAVEFEDGAVIAQLGVPDMKIPIQFAISYPKRFKSASKKLSLFDAGTLTFERADEETFICLGIAREAIKVGGTAPCIINSANEAAVAAFLDDKISFYRISELVEEAFSSVKSKAVTDLASVLDAEREAAEFVNSKI